MAAADIQPLSPADYDVYDKSPRQAVSLCPLVLSEFCDTVPIQPPSTKGYHPWSPNNIFAEAVRGRQQQ
ncbi:MAG TPA: hypothetical protein VMX94_07565 [Armatimonadota bacterium]|nr:hypothetical protein [Armatimonadota bacterium]